MKITFDPILKKLRKLDEAAAVAWSAITSKPANLMTGTGTANQIPAFTGTGGETTPLDMEEIPYGASISSYSNQSFYYDLTATPAVLSFNTINLQAVLNRAGSWKLTAGFVVEYVGATFAANQTIACKLRRSNNTATDITNSSPASFTLDIVTTKTAGICNFILPMVIYNTTNSDDIIQLFASISALPSAGSVRVKSAFILAEFLF